MAEKFNPQGLSKYFWVPTIAGDAAPTVEELAAGVDLTCAIMTDGVEGFAREPQYVDATPLCATAEENVPGLATTTNGAFTMHRGSTADSDNSALLDALVDDIGTEGYVVFSLSGGTAAGDLVDVFPSTLASVNPQPAVGGQVARYKVGFSHQGAFRINKPLGGDAGTPGAPTAVEATAGDGEATVTWVAPVDPGDSAITGYQVGVLDLDNLAATEAIYNDTASPYTAVGLVNEVDYRIRVRAVNSAGAGPWSTPDTVTPSAD